MSEPVSNVEIEDVLSSIRRLVSEENRPAARRDPQESPRKPSRLVLTPSLLVPVPDVDEALKNVKIEGAEEQAETPVTDQSVDQDDDTFVDPVASEAASADYFSAEGMGEGEPDQVSDPQDDFTQAAESQSDTLDLTEFEADSGLDSVSDVVPDAEPEVQTEVSAESDTDTAPWSDPKATLFQAAESAPDPEFLDIDEDLDSTENDVAETAEHSQFDSGDDDTTSDAAELPEAELDTTEPDIDSVGAPVAEDDAVADETPAEDATPEVTDLYNTATLSAKIAVLEAKIGQTQDQWEPDGETDDDYAGTSVETIEWQDHTEDSVDSDPTPEPEFVPPPAAERGPEPDPEPVSDIPAGETLDFLPEDEAILDEDSLRELVSDIVRQELQGALGERITRNVRKLVRREIHRALTAQELD